MRILPFAALALVSLAPVAQAQNTATRSTSGALLTLDEAINVARRNNPVYLSQATSRRTADAAVRSARGAMLPERRRQLRHALPAGRPAGVQRPLVQQQLGRGAVELWAEPQLPREHRDVRASEGRRRESRRRRRGHQRIGRAAPRGGDAAVPERAAGAGALRAPGHAAEDGRIAARAGEGEARRRSGHVARHPSRRGGVRPVAGRAAHGPEQRRGREAPAVPAARRGAAVRRPADDGLPREPADVRAGFAARARASPEPGDPGAAVARARRRAEREGGQGGVHAHAQPEHGLGWQLVPVHGRGLSS